MRGLLLLPLLASCAEVSIGDTSSGGGPEVPEFTDLCAAAGNLEIVPLDVWGRDLEATITFDRTPTILNDDEAGPGVLAAPLGGTPFSVQVIATADEHNQANLRLTWDGEEINVTQPGFETWWATGKGERTLGNRDCEFHTLYIGLAHNWFSPTAAAPTRNSADLLINGEEAWSSVAEDLPETTERVTASSWWWYSDFELVRPHNHADLSTLQRRANTIMSHFEELGQNVERRVLINRFWGENSDWAAEINTDSELRSYATKSHDNFEVILQANETAVPLWASYEPTRDEVDFTERVLANPRYSDRRVFEIQAMSAAEDITLEAASWHQKAFVLDGEIAYVLGMNIKGEDWDTSEHLLFDERRMDFDASSSEREDVTLHESRPDFTTRRDYGVRLQGPAATDVEAVLHSRWEDSISNAAMYSENATTFELSERPSPRGSSMVQIATTGPDPDPTQGVLEAHVRAIRNATEFIYIEDQYFRTPIINQALLDQMEREPNLRLVVVSMVINDYDGGAKYTWLSEATFRELYSDRFLLLTLHTHDLYLDEGLIWDTVEFHQEPIFIHSKLRIIDDTYLSVGSTNMNNRGYLYEGEMNAEILDSTFARSAREDILEQLVGERWKGQLSSNHKKNFELLRDVAESNAEIVAWWEQYGSSLNVDEALDEMDSGNWPSGFVLPLNNSPDYWWDVGPDAF